MEAYATYTIHPTAQQVLQVLAETASYHQKTYCYPNQNTILRSLRLRFGRQMSRRTLCRWMSYLEQHHYINRMKRHKRGKSGQLELHSTLYSFCRRAQNFLRSLASKLRYLIDYTAVSKVAHNLDTILESQPPTPAKSAVRSSSAARKGLRSLKEILQR